MSNNFFLKHTGETHFKRIVTRAFLVFVLLIGVDKNETHNLSLSIYLLNFHSLCNESENEEEVRVSLLVHIKNSDREQWVNDGQES
jgi:hypothetical protein